MTVTIQQTAKKYKGHMILGMLITIFGVLGIIFMVQLDVESGKALSIFWGMIPFGLCWYAISRYLAWWNHA